MNIENDNMTLPETVSKVLYNNKTIYLIGTAHVSKKSVDDVNNTFNLVNPDTICVELCDSRFKAMKNPENWKNTNIFRVVKEGKSFFLLAQLVMGAFYRKLGNKLELSPGAEMMEGIKLAEDNNKELILADRDVQVTLKRLWNNLSAFQKMKLLTQIVYGIFGTEEIDHSMIEEMKEVDQLESVIEEFAKNLPGVKEKLIDERDLYLTEKIRTSKGNTILAVVGAGHISGIKKSFDKKIDLAELEIIPKPSNLMKLIQWSIPSLIVFLVILGFFKYGKDVSISSIYIWFMVNGILSALGALLAFAHPLTILAAFVAAPFTSLNPMIAAGWVSGLVQAWAKKPTVLDFENLPNDVLSIRGFWSNPVCRVLLVVVLSNLGSSIGTFVAGSWIASKVF